MPTPLRRLAVASLLVALVLVGCGGDDDEPSSDSTTTTADDSADTSEATDTSEAEEEPAEEPGEDVTEPVTTAFTTFFHNFDGDPALLEDGDEFAAAIEDLRGSAGAAGTIDVDVKGVTPLDDADCEAAGTIAPCAEVAFDLVVAGDPAVPDQTGYAVYQDDTWKVSAATFCALTALGSGPPDAC